MSSPGVDAEQAIQAQSTQFYLRFNSNLADKDHPAYPMPDEMLMNITDFLLQIKDGSTVGQLKKEHPQFPFYPTKSSCGYFKSANWPKTDQ